MLNSVECKQSWVGNTLIGKSKRVFLQQDSVKPHTARRAKEKIKELDAIKHLTHPAYSLDFAPSDFHLFRSMAYFLRGQRFYNLEQGEAESQEFLNSKDKENRNIT